MKLRHTFVLLATLLVIAGCSGGSRRHSGTDASADATASGTQFSADLDKTISQPKQGTQTTEPGGTASDATVKLSVDNNLIDAGGSVTLLWDSANTDSCEASGGWSGSKATSGQQVINGIASNQTYSLSCTGAGGSAVSMVSVAVMGSLQISWQAPTENIDGTPVDPLSAFRIHYGATSGRYDSVVEVPGNVSSHTLDVVIGEYFIAMTAVDVEGDESGLSNEVVKNAT